MVVPPQGKASFLQRYVFRNRFLAPYYVFNFLIVWSWPLIRYLLPDARELEKEDFTGLSRVEIPAALIC